MKKQELVHLHGLLEQVRKHYEMESGDEVSVNRYEDLDTQSTSIHKSSTDHKEAVFALVHDITDELTTQIEDVEELLDELPDNISDDSMYGEVAEYLVNEEEATPTKIANKTGYSRRGVNEALEYLDGKTDTVEIDSRGNARINT